MCILCAKHEELRQVIELFDGRFERQRANSVGEALYKVNGIRSLLVATCNDMGHLPAAVRTAQIVQNHAPRVVIFVGTAASLNPKKVQVGDVVIPKLAISRYYDKVSESGQADYTDRAADSSFQEYLFERENVLVAEVRTIKPSDEALTMVADFDVNGQTLAAGEMGDIEIGGAKISLRNPKVHDDIDILSCGMVVDSLSYRDFLTKLMNLQYRKAQAIDMESYGFFSALEALRKSEVGSVTHGIMVRGISDYAGRKQQLETLPGRWKETSVRNAASVAADLVGRIARSF